MATIPQRGSVHDAGFDFERARTLVFLLDGVEQKCVTAYDCVAGTITRHVLDDNGYAQIAPGTDDVWVETVEGVVAVFKP